MCFLLSLPSALLLLNPTLSFPSISAGFSPLLDSLKVLMLLLLWGRGLFSLLAEAENTLIREKDFRGVLRLHRRGEGEEEEENLTGKRREDEFVEKKSLTLVDSCDIFQSLVSRVQGDKIIKPQQPVTQISHARTKALRVEKETAPRGSIDL
eukprot:TRINITY_DN5610_c1_g2_i1.p1 TRINITY_DN5610_c1_g2~~TRINITY_DN5610_c1_g2_i1.p1  ORF type:complete len:152 (+),score=32.21 TRINITY_DN5610_c1_g2_i1:85-540(+)